jgi:hypothetical protein
MTDFPRGLNDTVTRNDTLNRIILFLRVVLDTGGFFPSGFSASGFTKEIVQVIENLNKGELVKPAENIGIPSDNIIEAIVNKFGLLRNAIENITSSSPVTRIAKFIRNAINGKGFTVTGLTKSGFTLESALGLEDSVVKGEFRKTLNGFVVNDTVLRFINLFGNIRFIDDTVITSDITNRLIDMFRIILHSGGITKTGFTPSGFVVGDDGIIITGNISKGSSSPILETTIFDDVVGGVINAFGFLRNIGNTVAQSDIVGRLLVSSRSILESRGFTLTGFTQGFTYGGVLFEDAVIKSIGLAETVIGAEINVLSDTIEDRLIALKRNINNTVTQSDSVIRVIEAFRNVLEVTGFTFTGFTQSGFVLNQYYVTDIVNRVREVGRIINTGDIITRNDVVAEIINEFGNLRFIVETVTQSDSVDRVIEYFRNISEQFGFVISGFTTSGFTLNTGVPILDDAMQASGDFFREIFETSGFTLTGFTEGFYHAGGVFVGDVVSRLNVLTRILAESESISDAIKRGVTYGMVENITIPIETIIGSLGAFRTLLSSVGFTVSGFTKSGFEFSKGIYNQDIIQIVKHTGNLFRTINETAGFSLTGFSTSGFFNNGGVFVLDTIQKDVSKFLGANITALGDQVATKFDFFKELQGFSFHPNTSEIIGSVVDVVRTIIETTGFVRTGFSSTGFVFDNAIYVDDSPLGVVRITELFRNIVEQSGYTLSGFTLSGFRFNGGVYLLDSIGKAVGKQLSETITTNDDVVGVIGRVVNLVNTVVVSNIIDRVHGLVRTISAGSFTISGFTLSGFFTESNKIIIEDIVVGVTRIANFFRNILEAGGFTLTGFVISGFKIGGAGLNDVVTAFRSQSVTINDTPIIAISDVVARIINEFGNLRFVTENVVVGDIANRLTVAFRSVIDVQGFTISGFTITGFFTHATAISDIISGIQDRPRFIADGVTGLLDEVGRKIRFQRGLHTFQLTDFIILSDVATQSIQRILFVAENVVINDPIIRIITSFRTIGETVIVPVEELINGFTKFGVISEDVIINDIVGRATSLLRIISNTITTGDVVSGIINFFGIFRPAIETIVVDDGVDRLLVSLRAILEDSFSFTLSGFTASGFLYAGGVAVGDVIERGFGFVGEINTGDITAISDDVVEIINEFGNLRFFADTITQNDTVIRLLDQFRTFLEIQGFTTTGFTASGFFLQGGAFIHDSISSIVNVDLIRNIFETSGFTLTGFTEGFFHDGGVFVGDVVSRISVLTRTITTENIPILDTIKKAITYGMSEAVTIPLEVIGRQIDNFRIVLEESGFTATGFTEGFVKFGGIFVSDSVIRVTSGDFFRNIFETAGYSLSGFTASGFYKNGGVFVSDVVDRMLTLTRVTSSTTILDDIISRLGDPFSRIASETTVLDDVVNRISNFARTISESSGFTFSGFTLSGFTENFGISVSDVVDGQASIHAFFRTIFEGTGFTVTGFTDGFVQGGVQIFDIITKGVSYSIIDTVTQLDDVIGQINLFGTVRPIFDTVTQGDSVVRVIEMFRTIFETRGFTLTGFALSGFTSPETTGGGVFFSEIITSSVGAIRTVIGSENIVLGDIVERIAGFSRTLTESINPLDSVDRLIVLLREILEVSGFTVSGFTASGFVINITQFVGDTVSGSLGQLKNITDNQILLTDDVVTGGIGHVFAILNETVLQVDSIIRVLDQFRNIVEIRGFTWSGFTDSGFYKLGGVLLEDSISTVETGLDFFREIFESSGFTLTGFTEGFVHGGGVFIGDVVARVTSLNVALVDTISQSDVIAKVLSAIRNIGEPVINVSNIIGRKLNNLRIILEESGFSITGFTESGFVNFGGIHVADVVIPLKHTGNLFREIFESSGYTLAGFTSSGFFHDGGVFISDTISKDVGKFITDTITNNDIVGRATIPLLRTMVEGGISFLDSIVRKVDLNRIISVISGFVYTGFTETGFVIDRGVIVDEIIGGTTRIGNFFRDIAESSGYSLSGFTLSGFVQGGGVAINDFIFPRFYNAYVIITENTILSDIVEEIINEFGFLRPVIGAEIIVISDSVIRKIDAFRGLLESRGFTFSGFQLSGFTISDGIGGVFISDVVIGVKGFIRDITTGDTTSISDVVARIINEFGFIRNVLEVEPIFDTITRQLSLSRILLQIQGFISTGFTSSGFFLHGGANVFDSITAIVPEDFFRNIFESAGFTISGFTAGFTMGGGVFIGDTVARIRGSVRTASENVGVLETLISGLGRGLIESISVSNITNRILALNRILTATRGFVISGFTQTGFTMEDVAQITDSLNVIEHIGNLFRFINEASGFTQTGFTISGFAIGGGVQFIDTIGLALGKVIAETVIINDNVAKIKNLPAFIAESVISLSDGVGRLLSLSRVISEFRAFTEGFTLSGFTGGGVTIQDVVSGVISNVQFFRFIFEGRGFTGSGFTLSGFFISGGVEIIDDLITGIRGVPRLVTENVAISDNFVRLLELFRNLAENTIFVVTPLEVSFTDKLVSPLEAPIILLDSVIRRLDLQRILTNNVVLSDVVVDIANLFRLISETVVINDVVVATNSFLRNISETITQNDTVIRVIELFRTLSENIAVSDAVVRVIDFFRIIAETVTIGADIVQVARDVPRNILQFVANAIDSVDRLLEMFRIVPLETIIIPVETVIRSLGLGRILLNTIALSDDVVRSITLERILLNTVVINDAVNRTIDQFRAIIGAEIIALSDDVIRQLGLIRVLLNNVVVNDAVIRSITQFRVLLNNVVVNDDVDRVIDFFRNMSENVIIGIDNIITNITRLLPNTVVISDNVIRQIDMFRSVIGADIITLSDDVIRRLDQFRVLLNTVVVGDTVNRILEMFRIINTGDIITLDDAVIRTLGVVRELIENITVIDVVVRNTVMFRTMLDTVVLDDVLDRIAGKVREISEAVNLDDTIATTLGFFLSETVVLSDAVVRRLDQFRITFNTVVLSDSVIRVLANIRTLNENILLPHFLIAVVGNFRTLAENVAINDSVIRVIELFRALSENVVIIDVGNPDVDLFRTVIGAEIIVVSDAVIRQIDLFRALAENVPNITFDNVIRQIELFRILLNTVVINDVISRVRDVPRVLSETIVIPVESVIRRLDQFRLLADTIVVGDAVIRRLDQFRVLAETVIINDSLIRLQTAFRVLLNTVTQNDTVIRVLEMFRALSENIQPVDDIIRLINLTVVIVFNNVIIGAEVLVRQINLFRVLLNNVVVNDALADVANLFRIINTGDIIAVSDVIIAVRDRLRDIAEQAVNLTDDVIRQINLFRVLLNNVVIDDVGSPTIALFRDVIGAEIVTLSDDVIRVLNNFRVLLNTITLSDDVVRLMVEFRVLLNTVVINDPVVRVIELFRAVIGAEVITLSDTVTGIRNTLRFIAEQAVNLTDDVIRQIDLFRVLLNTIILDDNITFNQTFFRILLNTVVLSDDVIRILANIRVINDTPVIAVSDQVIRVIVLFRTLIESTLLPHFVIRQIDMFRSMAETVVLSESIFMGLFRDLAETITQNDTIIRVLELFRILLENNTAFEGVQRTLGNARIMIGAEVIALSDVVVRVIGAFRVIANTIVLDDVITYNQTYFRTLLNNVILDDAVDRTIELFRTIAETILFDPVDSILATRIRPADLFDTVVIGADNIVRQINLFRILLNSLDPLDDLKIALSRVVPNQFIPTNDQVIRVLNMFRTPLNTIIQLDEVIRQIEIFRILTNTITVDDIVTGIADLFRFINEPVINMIDEVVRIAGTVGSAFETIVVDDTIIRELELFRELIEPVIDIFEDLFSSFVRPSVLLFTTIIRPSILFNTTIRESITFPTRIRLSVVFLTLIREGISFGTTIKDSIAFTTILGMSDLSWNTVIRDSIIFGTIVKDTFDWNTVIRDSLDFVTRIKISLNFITRIKDSEGN